MFKKSITPYPNFEIIKPCNTFFGNNINVDIRGYFNFNLPWWKIKNKACGEFSIEDNASFIVDGLFNAHSRCSFIINKGATLHIGSGYINMNSKIRCRNSVTIGNGVMIGENVYIRDSDAHTISGSKNSTSAPVVINDHVWIGSNVTILKGVTIGSGSVIGAGSVVTKSIPDKCLAVGNPARVIRENIEWS